VNSVEKVLVEKPYYYPFERPLAQIYSIAGLRRFFAALNMNFILPLSSSLKKFQMLFISGFFQEKGPEIFSGAHI
jgi:hypothetical protein